MTVYVWNSLKNNNFFLIIRLTNNTNELASINANDVVVYLRSLTESNLRNKKIINIIAGNNNFLKYLLLLLIFTNY